MKHKKMYAISLGVILLLAIIIRIVYINHKYPSPKKEVYDFGQEMPFYGAKIKAVDCQIYTREQMQEQLDTYDYETIFNAEESTGYLETKVVLVTLDIRNESEEFVNPSYLSILTGTVSNGVNVRLINVLNENGCRVEGNSQNQIILAYTITKNNVPSKKWNDFENEEFSLTYGDRQSYKILRLK